MVPGHIAQVIHDVAFDEWVRKSARIAEHPSMRTTMQRVLGEKRAREISDWIKFVSNQQAVTARSVPSPLSSRRNPSSTDGVPMSRSM